MATNWILVANALEGILFVRLGTNSGRPIVLGNYDFIAWKIAADATQNTVDGKIETGLEEALGDEQRDRLIWAARFDASMAVAYSSIAARNSRICLVLLIVIAALLVFGRLD